MKDILNRLTVLESKLAAKPLYVRFTDTEGFNHVLSLEDTVRLLEKQAYAMGAALRDNSLPDNCIISAGELDSLIKQCAAHYAAVADKPDTEYRIKAVQAYGCLYYLILMKYGLFIWCFDDRFTIHCLNGSRVYITVNDDTYTFYITRYADGEYQHITRQIKR